MLLPKLFGFDLIFTVNESEMGAVYGLCNGQEQEREKQRSFWRRERKWEKEGTCGPVTVINWDPHEFSLNLNPDWIQKQVKG